MNWYQWPATTSACSFWTNYLESYSTRKPNLLLSAEYISTQSRYLGQCSARFFSFFLSYLSSSELSLLLIHLCQVIENLFRWHSEVPIIQKMRRETHCPSGARSKPRYFQVYLFYFSTCSQWHEQGKGRRSRSWMSEARLPQESLYGFTIQKCITFIEVLWGAECQRI